MSKQKDMNNNNNKVTRQDDVAHWDAQLALNFEDSINVFLEDADVLVGAIVEKQSEGNVSDARKLLECLGPKIEYLARMGIRQMEKSESVISSSNGSISSSILSNTSSKLMLKNESGARSR